MDGGLIHIYTGNGKGKTTAALGLCFRATGHGYRCAFIQFLKARDTGEKYSCAKTDPVIIFEQYGTEDFVRGENSESAEKQKAHIERGLARAREVIGGGEFDVVVLDEIITLPLLKICGEERIIQLMELDRGKTELVLTGRGAGGELIRRADLVTEMKEIRHYYSSGVPARKGIEY
ncbi:MAG TPA: cob(I)yrinic acid a,c-diamide adenosyltransferase [Spirochaetota bacterium]|nr:cob(I)yrinic acid a,c-diamide adenosyltransferase [Spirochaetota bacterium]